MFEFDKYQPERSGPRTEPQTAYTPFRNFRRRALLQWGEHCVECAAPACFATCDLYDARPDKRCRRFAYGIFCNTAYPCATGAGAEVVFRRWGKLEARANAKLFDAATVRRLEKTLLRLAPFMNAVGRAVNGITGNIRWSYLTFGLLERLNRRLHNASDQRQTPDAFIVEVYNPTAKTATLLLSMSIVRTCIRTDIRADQLPSPFLRKLSFAPGYNLSEIPFTDFAEIIGSGLPFGISLTPEAVEGTHLVFLCLDLIQYSNLAKTTETKQTVGKHAERVAAKCVVFDLDNTLWDGVLLEGDVRLRHGITDLFRELDRRGILISVCSKNSYDIAITKLREFALADYLLYPQIGWGQKSAAVGEIARNLDIGLDTFIFVDDNPFEREEVARIHPTVEVLAETELTRLTEHQRLQGSNTLEASNRRLMYQQAQKREAVAVSFGEDYIGFLRSCQIELDIFEIVDDSTNRVVELVQRTNQLNFSGRKYTRDDFRAILADKTIRKTGVACRDKFGDYGIIGVCIWHLNGNQLIVQDLMISCRVQGKFIEQALFHYLMSAAEHTPERFLINFQKTDRNGLAKALLDKLGFTTATEGQLERTVSATTFEADFIHITQSTPNNSTRGRVLPQKANNRA